MNSSIRTTRKNNNFHHFLYPSYLWHIQKSMFPNSVSLVLMAAAMQLRQCLGHQHRAAGTRMVELRCSFWKDPGQLSSFSWGWSLESNTSPVQSAQLAHPPLVEFWWQLLAQAIPVFWLAHSFTWSAPQLLDNRFEWRRSSFPNVRSLFLYSYGALWCFQFWALSCWPSSCAARTSFLPKATFLQLFNLSLRSPLVAFHSTASWPDG